MTKSTTIAIAQTPAQIVFENSLAKIKTGNVTVDAICVKLIKMIKSKEVIMDAVQLTGEYKTVAIKIQKVVKGKTSRYILNVGDLEIGGAFAAKAYNFSLSQNKVSAVSTKSFDTSAVEAASLLFSLD